MKNVKILEFGDYIWDHCEKCIQISTDMPNIGLVICEIAFEAVCDVNKISKVSSTDHYNYPIYPSPSYITQQKT